MDARTLTGLDVGDGELPQERGREPSGLPYFAAKWALRR
jgi:hypothetical protein